MANHLRHTKRTAPDGGAVPACISPAMAGRALWHGEPCTVATGDQTAEASAP